MRSDNSSVSRRHVLIGVGSGLAGLAGCTGEDQPEAGPGAETTARTDTTGTGTNGEGPTAISITALWTEGEQEAFQQVLDRTEQEANVTIEYHPRDTNSLKTGTLMDYQSGVAPADIVVMPFPARIRSDARAGHLTSLGNTWDPSNYAVGPEQVSVDGRTYAAPYKMDLKPGFWYRRSFFEEHGLSPPDSYEGFRALLDELAGIDGVDAPIASGNGVGWPLSDQVEAFFLRQENGAQLHRDLIAGDADFTDDRVRTAFEEVRSLLQAGRFSQTREFAVQYEYFWQNRLPLYFMGSWTPAMNPVKDASDLGVFRLPGVDGMVGSINWLTVPSYSENQSAAIDAVEFITSAEGQRIWAEQGGFIASNTTVPRDAYSAQIMGELSQLASEVTIVADLDDSLGSPFQDEFWARLKGLWAQPEGTNMDQLLSALDTAQDESLQQ